MFTFASAQKRNRRFLLATRATRRSVLRRLSSRTFEAHRRDNTHLRFSSRRAHHEIEEETCRYILSSPVACSLLRVHRRGTNWFLLATRATKIFKNIRFLSAEMVEQHHHRRRRRRRRSVDVENRIFDENNNNNSSGTFCRNVLRKQRTNNRDLVCTIAHAKTFSQVLSESS